MDFDFPGFNIGSLLHRFLNDKIFFFWESSQDSADFRYFGTHLKAEKGITNLHVFPRVGNSNSWWNASKILGSEKI